VNPGRRHWRGTDAPSILSAAILRETLGSAMAKKARKKPASKAAKKSKGFKKKGAMSKKKRKAAAKKKSKPVAKKRLGSKPPPKSFPGKVAGAFTALADTLTDAERLHHKLDPGVSREPE
jgi:hypothetical protein